MIGLRRLWAKVTGHLLWNIDAKILSSMDPGGNDEIELRGRAGVRSIPRFYVRLQVMWTHDLVNWIGVGRVGRRSEITSKGKAALLIWQKEYLS